MSLTELELKVLKEIANCSNWNNNPPLDFSNPDYKSQVDEYTYQVFVDAKYRAEDLEMKVNSYKGALGSLQKKGCLSFWDGDGCDDLVCIDLCNFKKIREHLGL